MCERRHLIPGSGITCPGCGGDKLPAETVCPNCFKHRRDVVPFKYFTGTLSEWLATVRG